MDIREAEKQREQVSSRKAATRQWRIGLIVSLGSLTIGFVPGWIAATLPKFTSGDSTISVNLDQAINLALVVEIGHFLMPVPSGILADVYGRKTVFLLSVLLSVGGWSTILFARTVSDLIIGRTALGFGYGAFLTLMNIYVSEVMCNEKRGAFNSMLLVFQNTGVLIMFVLGSFTIRLCTLVATVVTCAELLLVFYIIESPYYYARKGAAAQGLNSLAWLRGSDNASVINEFNMIKKNVTITAGPVESLKLIVSEGNYKGLGLVLILTFLSEMMGSTTALLFASKNFDTFCRTGTMSTDTFVLLLGTGKAVLCLLPTLLSDKVGRKILISDSAIFAGLLHLVSALWYFFNKATSIGTSNFEWLLAISTVAAICCSSVYEPTIMTLRGELLSLNSRGIAAGFVSMVKGLGTVVCIELYDALKAAYGEYACFGVLSLNCFIMVAVVWRMLPETNNLTLAEIQDVLRKNKNDVEQGPR